MKYKVDGWMDGLDGGEFSETIEGEPDVHGGSLVFWDNSSPETSTMIKAYAAGSWTICEKIE